jgi:NADH:ubiquinone oxidoreductase subunit 5 (subunit L)/multisubunit Na+/H+ antiporter MnhA subunit
MTVTAYLVVAGVLPLVTFLLLVFLGRRIGRYAGAVATGMMLGTLALTVGALISFVGRGDDRLGSIVPVRYAEAHTRQWVRLPAPPAPVDGFGFEGMSGPAAPGVTVGLYVDSLTVGFCLIVAFLSTLVHLFSLGYLRPGGGEPRAPRYFALLNLLIFATFGLLLSNALLQLFVMWQLLGIAGYFLIQFYADRRGPVMGSLRTFVVNRIGDAAFLMGIGMLVSHAGQGSGWTLFDAQGASVLTETIRKTLQVRSSEFLLFSEGVLGLHWLTWTGICFATAALVRAAQFPFFTWLTDTAEAPAPVAALLQTCTSVAAGIYLLARLYPILTLDVRLILAIVGCATVVLGALVACTQTDFRRILAWTTASQMGYVVLFLGAGGYVSGILHLFTHAFTKTGLLLAAASVMQALPGQTDLRPLGGLWKRMPITAGAALIVVLALAGTPVLSGSYSTNLGLAAVYDYAVALAPGATRSDLSPAMLLYWLPALATYVTAFAAGRWWWLLFVAPARNPKLTENVHESAPMTLPLIIAAGFTAGLMFEFLLVPRFIEQSLPPSAAAFAVRGSEATHNAVRMLTIFAPAGALAAFLFYLTGFGAADRVRRTPGVGLLYVQLREAFFLDALYHGVLVRGVLLLAWLAYDIDRYVLSAAYRLLAFVFEGWAHLVAGLDAWIDRPVRRAAWALAPLFRRDPPPPPSPGAGGTPGNVGE